MRTKTKSPSAGQPPSPRAAQFSLSSFEEVRFLSSTVGTRRRGRVENESRGLTVSRKNRLQLREARSSQLPGEDGYQPEARATADSSQPRIGHGPGRKSSPDAGTDGAVLTVGKDRQLCPEAQPQPVHFGEQTASGPGVRDGSTPSPGSARVGREHIVIPPGDVSAGARTCFEVNP